MTKLNNKFGVNLEDKVVPESVGYTAKEFMETQTKLINKDFVIDMNPMPEFVLVEKIYDIPIFTLNLIKVHLGRDVEEVSKSLNNVNAFKGASIVRVGSDAAPLTVGVIPEIDVNATLGISSVYIESVNADVATVSAQVASLPAAIVQRYIKEGKIIRAYEYILVRTNAIKAWR